MGPGLQAILDASGVAGNRLTLDIRQSRPLTGTLVGDYSPNHIQVVNMNLVWRF